MELPAALSRRWPRGARSFTPEADLSLQLEFPNSIARWNGTNWKSDVGRARGVP
jgi:hypothetical protein